MRGPDSFAVPFRADGTQPSVIAAAVHPDVARGAALLQSLPPVALKEALSYLEFQASKSLSPAPL